MVPRLKTALVEGVPTFGDVTRLAQLAASLEIEALDTVSPTTVAATAATVS